VNALAVLEGKLSFLTSVAQSVRGAHALLHSGIPFSFLVYHSLIRGAVCA
jgi:hypothetical protein